MSIEKIFQWILFCAGIITSIFAGYMFYIDNIAPGAAWLAVAVGFLCFATRVKDSSSDAEDAENSLQADRELHDMAILIAELAVTSLKNIGRTVPPGKKEIEDLETKLENFLTQMPLEQSERDEINEEFDRLKNKNRRSENDRAIFRQLGIRN